MDIETIVVLVLTTITVGILVRLELKTRKAAASAQASGVPDVAIPADVPAPAAPLKRTRRR